ncbi:hypothetical protein FRC02_012430 [Tulasnella sp. 418]|nr:hypothetical protein FRC02_012430 [Tulasnella sp. 418]
MPSPAVIVGGVVITAGAIYVFKEYGWPHVEPTAREIVEEIKSLWERASGHRRRAAPHHSHTSRSSSPFDDSEETKRHSFHSSSTSSDDESGSSTAFRRSSRMHESVEMTHLVKDETNGWADQGSHIRRRKAPPNELGVAGLPLYDEQQQHPLTRSTTSSTSSNQFQPVHASSSGVRSPENARATSPSGLSDNMSMVSATPSRTWTDGGTAEIFSGSEKDFRGNDSDRDDIESVSDSGSWEDVGAGVASPRAGGAGRLSR